MALVGQIDNEHPFKDTDRHAGEGGHRIDGPAECWTPNTTLVRQRKAVGIDSQPAGFWSQATCASGRLRASRARPPLARPQGRSKTYKNTVTRWYVQSPPVLLLITLTPSSLHMRCTEFTHPEPPAPLDEGSGAAKPTWCVKYLGAAGSARPQTGHGADIVGGWRWAGADLQGLQPFGRGTLAPAVWIWGRGMLPFFQLGLAPGDLGLWGRGGSWGGGRGAGVGENICDNPRRRRAKCGHRTPEGGMCWRLGGAVGAADFTKGDWSQLGHLDTLGGFCSLSLDFLEETRETTRRGARNR